MWTQLRRRWIWLYDTAISWRGFQVKNYGSHIILRKTELFRKVRLDAPVVLFDSLDECNHSPRVYATNVPQAGVIQASWTCSMKERA